MKGTAQKPSSSKKGATKKSKLSGIKKKTMVPRSTKKKTNRKDKVIKY